MKDNSLTFDVPVHVHKLYRWLDYIFRPSGPGVPEPPPSPRRELSQYLILVFCGRQEIVEAPRMSNQAL